MFHASHQTIKILAATIWFSGFLILFIKSSWLFFEAWQKGMPLLFVFISLLIAITFGTIKGHFFFSVICKKNLQRINELANPFFWQCYQIQFYFFLALMITMSKFLYHVVESNTIFLLALAMIEMSVGIALFTSGKHFKVKK
jgi:hypothetical protein